MMKVPDVDTQYDKMFDNKILNVATKRGAKNTRGTSTINWSIEIEKSGGTLVDGLPYDRNKS